MRVHVCFHMCFILRVLGSTGCVHVSVCMYVACSYVRMYRLFGGMCVCVCARVYVYMSTYSSRLFSRGRIVCVCGSIVSASYVCVLCACICVHICAACFLLGESCVFVRIQTGALVSLSYDAMFYRIRFLCVCVGGCVLCACIGIHI